MSTTSTTSAGAGNEDAELPARTEEGKMTTERTAEIYWMDEYYGDPVKVQKGQLIVRGINAGRERIGRIARHHSPRWRPPHGGGGLGSICEGRAPSVG